MMESLLRLVAVLSVLWAAACSAGGQAPPASQPSAAAPGRAAAPAGAGVAKAAEAGAASATTAAPSPPALGEVRFVFPVPAMRMLPMHIAATQGFDQEEGFTASFVQAPGSTGVRALQAGEVDFSMSAGASLAAAVQGVPIRIVVVHVAKSLFWLYSRPDVTQLDQLPGRTLAVDALGGSQDVAARLRLQRHGVDPGSIYFIAMGGGQIPGALVAGAVDAGVIAPPQDIQLAREGQFTNHGFLGDDLPSLSSGLGTTETLIAQKPEMVRAAVRAALKGQRFLQTNRAAALPIMADYLSLSAAEAAQAYDSAVPHFTADGRVPPELQERMVQDQIEVVQPERVPRAQDLFALQFIPGN
jgi:NitT/TauT family transport system substrate-binding protein